MISVTVYSTGPQCEQCRLTCRRLDEASIPYRLIDITDDEHAAAREFLTDDLGYAEAPVVIVDHEPENHWSGFRAYLIDRLVARITAEASAGRVYGVSARERSARTMSSPAAIMSNASFARSSAP